MTGEWASKVEVSVFLREDASSDEIEALGRNIESIPEVDAVFFENREQAYANFQQLFRDEQAILKRLLAVTSVLRTGVIAVAAIMLLSAAGLIGNTVRMAVFARRKEIAIMKLVGATNWFIRVPFLIEGVVEGLIGAGVAILAIFAMKVVFIDPLRGQVSFVPTWVGTAEIVQTVPILLAAGVLIAGLASLLAMRRFLEV